MQGKLSTALFLIRISVALVLIMWTVDKFVNPSHAINVFDHFYFISGISTQIMTGIAVAELILIALFLIGRFKDITYLIVLIIHGVSTVTPISNYLNAFESPNLLFFAAWPMLAACYALYSLRHYDNKFNL
ncbi:MAG: hypothetical protein P8I38_10530 [Arenicella sp.]|jgi:putative oxidoreductase|nr:hypothetical protein [bacterium]MDG1906047.1 hypothetical protein [Arenicella sp.]HAU68336.1 hypothetical protein [Gammaproteobacteria bacterium]